MSTEIKTLNQNTLPAELKQLPIFQVLGNEIKTVVDTPKTRKTVASVFYWAASIAASIWFFTNIDTLLA